MSLTIAFVTARCPFEPPLAANRRENASVPASEGSGAVSPTAHYTGETWVRGGLSHPGLRTWQGRVFHGALAVPLAASRSLGGPTLEGLLLARHRIIDSILDQQIEGGVGQVIEVACGMSPRGWRFSERYGDRLTYIEADLPAMAQRKREALARMGSLSDHHRVADLDVLRDGGPGSLEALTANLDPAKGLAIVTEGLLTYFDAETVEALWARLAAALGRFERGAYLADLRVASEDRGASERAFALVLGAFVRGRVHVYREDEAGTEAALRRAGFARVQLHRGDQHPAAGDAGADPAAASIHVLAAET
jgi:O-methyltransferase involved in polyketide biosynthesis